MTVIAVVLVALPLVLAGYCWFVYPLWLAVSRRRAEQSSSARTEALPAITIVITAHNAGAHLRATLDSILAEGYPAERRQILVVSDGSVDDTVGIARSLRCHNVRVHRIRRRVGKTAAENEVAGQVRSEIVVCIDAHVCVEQGAITALVQALRSPTVGIASGTDVSVGTEGIVAAGERYYVSREMRLREAESRWSGIVGASGCFYATRRWLYCTKLPATLTRDFASVLLARRAGLTSVSVPAALCRISTSASGRSEFARKVRTILQGIQTLVYFQDLLHPFRFGRFAIALFSHKLCRWLVPLFVPPAVISSIYLFAQQPNPIIAACVSGAVLIAIAAARTESLRIVSYGLLVQAATVSAWFRFMRRQQIAKWDPTPRSIPGVRLHQVASRAPATGAIGSTASSSAAVYP